MEGREKEAGKEMKGDGRATMKVMLCEEGSEKVMTGKQAGTTRVKGY